MKPDEEKVPMTKAGLEELKKEYQQMVDVRRPKVVDRLSSARTQGDLAENSEYTIAKEELAFIDGRVDELADLINRAVAIDEDHKCCQSIKLGCKVTVDDNKNQKVFHLVGEWEADPASSKISHQSPLGKSLMGRKIGDKVEFEAPAGKVVYTIVKID